MERLKSPALRPGKWAVVLALIAFSITGFAKDKSTKAEKPSKAALVGRKAESAVKKLFDGDDVPRISIEISEEGMDVLKKYQWTFGQQQDREKVQATIREGGIVYTNVALHLKGAAGSFRAVDEKPAFTLNFDKFAKGQKFHGLEKLSLNNSVQDPTYVSEQFCREMFLKAGVPVPRATHARVDLNGRDLGLYVLVEGWDKEFLKRHFKNTKGNLYDGGFVKEITDELSTNSGDNPKEQSDRKALVDAAQESNLVERQKKLEQVLDVERFLSFVAMDVMLWDWDGYPLNKNNWRLYHDMDKDKMVFMPHGLDQMFWNPTGPVLPGMQGLVANAVLEIPEWRDRYFKRVKELRAAAFDPEVMTNRVRQLASKIRPILSETEPKGQEQYEKTVSDFCSAISRRAQSLDEQLAVPIVPLKFDQSGLASLENWESKITFGKPRLLKSDDASQGRSLRIATHDGSSIGLWTTTVWLEKGSYKLEGRIRTKGLEADPGDPRAGAGLRTKNRRAENYRTGDSDWKQTEIEFDVQPALTQIQLVCEFRGAEGEAWFDMDSLKIRKVLGKSPKEEISKP